MAIYYRVQLVKRGPYVPLKLWYSEPIDPLTGQRLERPAMWRAVRNGREVPIWDVIIEFDGQRFRNPPAVYGDPITKEEYEYYDSLNKWAREHAPDTPEAKPRDPIDLNRLPPIFKKG